MLFTVQGCDTDNSIEERRVDYYDSIIGKDPEVCRARARITETLKIIRQTLVQLQAPPSIISQLLDLEDYITELESEDVLAIARADADEISIAVHIGMLYEREQAVDRRGGAKSDG